VTVEIFKPTLEQLKAFPARNPNPYNMDSPILMMTIEETPICVYAATQHMSCIELHCFVSQEVRNFKELFHEMTKEMIAKCFTIFKNYDLLVMDVEPQNQEWAKRLGFQLDNDVKELDTLVGMKTYSLKREDI
jgi:hypothetical protein